MAFLLDGCEERIFVNQNILSIGIFRFVMYNRLLISPIYILLFIFIISGCSKDDQKIGPTNLYFQEASVTYQNGDFDKAVKYYKLYLSSNHTGDEALLQYVNLQLAKISFSKGNYDEAMIYANKVRNSDLFFRAYWQKEETFFNHSMKGLLTDKETDKINSFGYSLKNNALTIIGSCYLRKNDYGNAINNFKDIDPASEGYYYLALAYGLKGDIINERSYYELNLEKGTIGLIETKEWLENNSKSK
jgi:outer membrane protein assembly factor BamD (BamD/ComL family)